MGLDGGGLGEEREGLVFGGRVIVDVLGLDAALRR